jgi:hypothetical protein
LNSLLFKHTFFLIDIVLKSGSAYLGRGFQAKAALWPNSAGRAFFKKRTG